LKAKIRLLEKNAARSKETVVRHVGEIKKMYGKLNKIDERHSIIIQDLRVKLQEKEKEIAPMREKLEEIETMYPDVPRISYNAMRNWGPEFCCQKQDEMLNVKRMLRASKTEIEDRIEKAEGSIERINHEICRRSKEEKECQICNENKRDHSIDCGHIFCRKCINRFQSRVCPICRKPIREKPRLVYV